MGARDAVVGIVVLGVILGGVYWTRARSHEGVMPSGATAAPTTSATAHDVTQQDATVEVSAGVRVTLSLSPRPPLAFAPLQARVQVAADGAPVTDAHVTFTMDMPMGDHRYVLVPADGGWLQAEVVLPLCASGNPRWYATVDATVADRPVRARFHLNLTKPR